MSTFKTLLTRVTDALSGAPVPSAPPTRLIGPSTPPGNYRFTNGNSAASTTRRIDMTRMTKDTLRQIIDQVDLDPLAGMGAYTKKEILIDRLLAHWNTVEARPEEQPTQPKPVLAPVERAVGGGVSGGTAAPARIVPTVAPKTAQ